MLPKHDHPKDAPPGAEIHHPNTTVQMVGNAWTTPVWGLGTPFTAVTLPGHTILSKLLSPSVLYSPYLLT